MKTQIQYISIMALIFLFSCQGEKGDPGPAGPPGSNGSTGPVGPQGATGAANVIYSNWIGNYTWTPTIYESFPAKYFKITAPNLSSAIWNQGVILVYIKFPFGGGFNSIKLLPYDNISLPSINDKYFFNSFIGSIDIICLHLNSTFFAYTNSEFRYVLIPGGTSGGRLPALDYSDYNEVKSFYNLPD